MTTDTDTSGLFEQLRILDAAPASSITPADHDRRETMLFGIFTENRDTAPRRTARKARLVWGSIGASAALLGAAAFGAVVVAPHALHAAHSILAGRSGEPLPAAQLASWTSTPQNLSASSPLAAKAQSWCKTQLSGVNGTTGTPAITNLDARGDVASLIYSIDGQVYYCVSGGDGTGMWEIADATPSTGNVLTASSALIDTAGTHGDKTPVSYATGFAGTDVTSITLHEPGHPNIATTIQDGRWTAWWPVSSDTASGGPIGTATITTTHGTSQTVESSTLYQK